MVTNNVECPSCGSNSVSRHVSVLQGKLAMGSDFDFEDVSYTCDSCDEEGDFTGESDRNFLIAQKSAQAALVKKILDDMNEIGISMAMFERVFELPNRTLTRWKNGDFSATTIALLRIIATYPWIIGVAENKFEPRYASIVVVKVAADALSNASNPVISYSVPKEDCSFGLSKHYGNAGVIEAGA